jgi:hypothetical protein
MVHSWVYQLILTCDNQFAITFNRYHRGVPRPGLPGVTCLYPGVPGEEYFNIALAYGEPGKFVHDYLYKKQPYQIIASPCPASPCGVVTSCSPDPVSTSLVATLVNLSGCPSTASFALDLAPLGCGLISVCWTTGHVTCGAADIVISIACLANGWNLISWDAGEGAALPLLADSASSSPFVLQWNSLSMIECCVGSVKLIVTS